MFDEKRQCKNSHAADEAKGLLNEHSFESSQLIELTQGHEAYKEEYQKIGPLTVHNRSDNYSSADQRSNDPLCQVTIAANGIHYLMRGRVDCDF